MFNTHYRRTLLCLKAPIFTPTLKPFLLFHHYPFLPFCTNTSHYSPSFPVTYLINNFGFSPQSASKLSSTHRLVFKTSEKPDSVLSFFRNYGFSDTQLHNIITKEPSLLSCNPSIRVFPKFQFFLSKGLSTSHIVNLVTKNPKILHPSLENQIAPNYELVYKFLKSDKGTIAVLNHNPSLFCDPCLSHNIILLIENGVTESNIARLLRTWSRVFYTRDGNKMLNLVKELKDMGFHPSTSTFAIALMAKVSVSTTLWNEKCDVFKKWGWSHKDIMKAFRCDPHCMLVSVPKINSVMSFWVNQLGWDALAIVKGPRIIGLNLERRIIPRAAVVQFLLKNDLRKTNSSLTSPFLMTEKLFVDKFIKQFAEDSSYLLKLYKEKLKLGYRPHQGEH